MSVVEFGRPTDEVSGARFSGVTGSFDVQALKTPFFKIIVADESLDWPEYYIHKEILSSVSPEMKRHIVNEMQEGSQGEIVLREVDDETVQHFLEWVYVKSYTMHNHDERAHLLAHLKVYVFADRFNIKPLQDLSCSHLSKMLTGMSLAMSLDLTAIIEATRYAVENLQSLRDKAIDCLLHRISNTMSDAKDLTELQKLIDEHQPELGNMLLHAPSAAVDYYEPTWKSGLADRGFVCRILRECSGCQKIVLIVRGECSRHWVWQANEQGWFTSTTVGSGICPDCGLRTMLMCRSCWNATMDSYRDAYADSPVGYYDYDSPPLVGVYDQYDIDSPPLVGMYDQYDIDSPPVPDSPVSHGYDSPPVPDYHLDDQDDDTIDNESYSGDYGNHDDEEVTYFRYPTRIHRTGSDTPLDIDREDIFDKEEACEDSYGFGMYDRDSPPHDDDYYDDDILDVNDGIEDQYDPDCFDGDLDSEFID